MERAGARDVANKARSPLDWDELRDGGEEEDEEEDEEEEVEGGTAGMVAEVVPSASLPLSLVDVGNDNLLLFVLLDCSLLILATRRSINTLLNFLNSVSLFLTVFSSCSGIKNTCLPIQSFPVYFFVMRMGSQCSLSDKYPRSVRPG